MPDTTEAYDFRGRTLIDADGEKIGKIDELYLDEQGGQPEWALVNTGLFGTKKTFVPIRGARPDGEELRVPVSKEQVKDAPRIDADQELSEEEERVLFEHYGVPYTDEGSTTATGAPTGAGSAGETGYARETGYTGETGSAGETGYARETGYTGETGPADETGYTGGAGSPERDRVGRDDEELGDDDAITRSEEELRVGTARRERGRVRLRKYVVTEDVQRTVPVRREEVRVEREPITDENIDQAMSGQDISEAEHEVVLHEEEPVVEKRAVPKERVRLSTETHEDEHEVSEQVRKERIEVDEDR